HAAWTAHPSPSSLAYSRRTNNQALHSFPTRRSSDLHQRQPAAGFDLLRQYWQGCHRVFEPFQHGVVQHNIVGGRKTRWQPCQYRSEEHTSELQSRENLVCRLLLEKKKFIAYSKLSCN